MSTYKEGVYDSEIQPLVTKITELCTRHRIALFAQFDLGVDEGDHGHIMATVALLEPRFEPDRSLKEAFKVAGPKFSKPKRD